jgi:hypothetical protein
MKSRPEIKVQNKEQDEKTTKKDDDSVCWHV